MNAKPVLTHCRALQLATRCFALGANARIVARITGIPHSTLFGMFFSPGDKDRPKLGRRSVNCAKIHRANLPLSVQASFFYSSYQYVRQRGHAPAESFISAVETYMRLFASNQLLTFDECFAIVRQADLFWSPTKEPGTLCLAVCTHCDSEYLAPAGTTRRCDDQCPFCRLSKVTARGANIFGFLSGVSAPTQPLSQDHPQSPDRPAYHPVPRSKSPSAQPRAS